MKRTFSSSARILRAGHESVRGLAEAMAPLLALALVLVLGTTGARAQVVYTADFNVGLAPGFSNVRVGSSTNGQLQYLGLYSNETTSLTLNNLVAGDWYRIDVSVLVMATWDGDGNLGAGPDFWSISQRGGSSFRTTFSVFPGQLASYPQAFPAAVQSPPGTNATISGVFGFPTCGSMQTYAHPVSLVFRASAATEIVDFAASGLESLCNEPWALDSVTVTRTLPLSSSDTCAQAISVVVNALNPFQSIIGSTASATVDAVTPCSGAAPTGPGIWFKFLGTGNRVSLNTCNFATFDTTISIYCGSCGTLNCIAANDDDCEFGRSAVSVCTVAGREYFVLVASPTPGVTGSFRLDFAHGTACTGAVACDPCTITIPGGAIAEGEPAATNGYVDTFNAGCSAVPNAFSNIAAGQTIAGKSGTFVRGGQDYRDTDWYQFTLAQPAEVLIVGRANFPLQLGLIDGRTGCAPTPTFDLGESRAMRCEEASMRVVLPAGRYIAFAAPSALSGVPSNSDYFITLTTTPVGSCAFSSGCSTLTAAACAAAGGTYGGNNTTCPDVGYVSTVLPFTFDDISSSGTALTFPNADDGGTTVAIGFPFSYYGEIFTQIGVSTNGYLRFGTTDFDFAQPRSIPDTRRPNNILAARWSNLNLDPASGGAGSVRTQVLGAAPTRRLVVQWTGALQFGTTNANTFQAVLFEGDGSIEFRYLTVQPAAFNGQVVIGAENEDGTRGTSVAAGQASSGNRVALRKGNLIAPIAVAGGPYAVSASITSVQASALNSSDPDGAPGFAGINTVQWDLGADGTGDDAARNIPQPVISRADALAKGLTLLSAVPLRLTVTDFDALIANDQTTVVYTNTAPVIAAGGPYGPITPGTQITLAAVATDVDTAFPVNEQLTVEWSGRAYTALADFGSSSTFATGAAPTVQYAVFQTLASATGTTIYANVRDRTGAIASASTMFSIDLPDLVVASVSGLSGAAFGTSVTITAQISNPGGGAAVGTWHDRIYLSTDATFSGDDLFLTEVQSTQTVAIGGSYIRTFNFALPVRFTGGAFRFIVLADIYGQLPEASNANNIGASALVAIAPTAAADFAVNSLTGPATGQWGQPINVAFVVSNVGDAAVSAATLDAVYLNTQPNLSGATFLANIPGPGTLAADATYSRTVAVPTPVNPAGGGNWYVVVRVDNGGAVLEQDENNNIRASSIVSMEATNSVNLIVAAASSPSTGVAGRPIDVTWTVTNSGQASATGAWFDRIVLRNPADGTDVVLGEFRRDGPLGAGGSYNSTQIVRLPSDIAGPRQICVITDATGTVSEPTPGAEADNRNCAAGMTVTLPNGPDFTIVTPSISTPTPTFGSAASVAYGLSNIGDQTATGTWTDRVFLSRDAALSADDFSLGFPDQTGPLLAGGMLNRNFVVNLPLTNEFDSGTYYIIVQADSSLSVAERLENNNITASIPLVISRPSLANLQALAIGTPAAGTVGQTVTVTWDVRNTGSVATAERWQERIVATVDGVIDGATLVLFTNTTPIAAATTVQRSASFTVPNLGLSYRLKLCVDTATEIVEPNEADNCLVSAPATINRPDLTITGLTVPATALADAQASISYTSSNVGAGGTPGTFLESISLVSLSSGVETLLDTFVITGQVPAGSGLSQVRSLNIPTRLEGQYAFKVVIDSTDAILESGPASNNTTIASAATTITQPGRGNLLVTGVQPISSGLLGSGGTAIYSITNNALAAVTQSWTDRVIAVRTDGPGEFVLADVAQAGPLNAGQSRSTNVNFTYPSVPGTYRIRIIADRADTVFESNAGETDNVFNTLQTFQSETFTVTADANVTSSVSGLPIIISGSARTIGSNIPVPNTPVEVRVSVQGTSREIRRPGDLNIVTDGSGNYAVTFNPVPTEGGLYTVLAGPRAAVPNVARDTFTLFAMNLGQSQFTQVIQSGVPTIISIPISNPGDVNLSGIAAVIAGDSSDLSLAISAPAALGPNQSSSVDLTITATSGTIVRRSLSVSITNAQGNSLLAFVNVEARPLQPTLIASPGSLAGQAVRGNQTLVSFRIENIGSGPATGLQLRLPDISWITASTPVIPDLGPGEGIDLTLRLAPAVSQSLGNLSGNLAVSNTAGTVGVSVPFNFRVVSERLTSLVVTVEDERSFYDALGNYIPVGGPQVENATVKLRDPVTGDVLFQSITSRPSGGGDVRAASFADIPERLYNVTVEAERHGTYSANLLIEEDGDPSLRIFIPFQAVRFNWIVEQIDVTEVTLITLEAVFETFVPAPVITISPTLIDLANYPAGGQVDITVTNHGLVAAEDVDLIFGTHPNWVLTPLTPVLGRLGPNQSRTIPVTISRLESGGPEAPCTLVAGVRYALVCIGRNLYSIPIPVLNAAGNCGGGGGGGSGGGWGGWGGGGGWGGYGGGGGGFGVGGSFTYPISTTNPPECRECDPATFQEQCYSRDFEADLNGVIGGLINSVTAAFPGLSTEVEFGVEGEGQICTCCRPDGGVSVRARGTATGQLSITFSTPGNELALPGNYNLNLNVAGTPVPVSVSFQARAGCELLKVTGSVTGTASTECGLGDPKLCVTGTLSLQPLNSCSLSATMNGTVTGGPYAGYAFTAGVGITLETNASLSASVSSCQEPPYNLCVQNDIKLKILLPTGVALTNPQGQQVTGDVPSPEITFQLYGPNCASVGYDCCGESGGGNTLPDVSFPRNANFNLPRMVARSVVRSAEPPEDGNGLCAQVRLQLEQSVAITRTAVSCTLEVDNALSTTPVENLRVQLAVFDEAGNDRTSLFGISTRPTLQGVTGIDGNGVVPAGRAGRINWIILPTRDAAPTQDVRYFFGGFVSYVQSGAPRTFVLTPTGITVRPDPRIAVKYFLQRDVYSDDPFTTEVEPVEPFSLGLMLTNSGFGTGRNVTITSAQPRIIENGRDLLIDFRIIGSQVGDQPVAPSLTMNFGDLLPQSTKVGRYVMTTTLLGSFTEFSATFRRRDDYGIDNDRVALIDSVTTYSLIHAVLDQRLGADTSPDFLTDELSGIDDPNENPAVPALRQLPDRIHLSNGTVQSVRSVLSSTLTPISGGRYTMTVPNPGSGFFYTVLADPFNATLRLTRVVRSDGRELNPAYNFWQTDRVFRDQQQPLRDYRLHLFDDGGSGSYTLFFNTPPAAPLVTGWLAEADHGSPVVVAGLSDLSTGEISDPRTGGPQRLVFTTNSVLAASSFNSGNFAISGRALDGSTVDLSSLSFSTSLRPDGRGGIITFSRPLPKKVRYCINLVGVSDSFGRLVSGTTRLAFSTVPADVSGDRAVGTFDYNTLLTRIGVPVTANSDQLTLRSDLNRDGAVDELDLALVTASSGTDMRWVADPCFGATLGNGGDPQGTQSPPAFTYDEIEPNSTYATATRAYEMTFNDRLTGATRGNDGGTGLTSADLFRVSPAELPLGIYRHRLQLTSPGGPDQFTTRLLGRTQDGENIGAFGSAVLQQVAPPISGLHYNQFYSFGQPGEIALRISGTAATTASYIVTMKTEPISPVPLGEFAAGNVLITTAGQGHGTDTEVLIYDSALRPVPTVRSDDASPLVQASLMANLTNGVYFILISDANTADDEPMPATDNNRARPVADYPGVVVNSSTAFGVPLHFRITSADRDDGFRAVKPEAFGVYFGVLTAVGGCLADVSSADGSPVPDGVVDGNDFIFFLNAFAAGDPSVDIVGAGGVPGADGNVDGEDFSAFLNAFGSGC